MRGKIVAVMRGPRPPSHSCSYSIKMYHVQNAGGVGVVFVDYDPDGVFRVIPRAESGPLWPGGPCLAMRIPAFFTLNSLAGALQEGAVHTLAPLGSTPKGLMQGWRVGVVYCRRQESSCCGMSKASADDVMLQFFSQRRQERVQENELLQEQLEDMKFGLDASLQDKEWVHGGMLDSINFLKQDSNAPAPITRSGTVTQAIFSKVTSEKKARQLAKHAESAGEMLGSLFIGAVATMTGETGMLQCAAECCSVLQSAAVCCRVLQCAAVCCSVLQCVIRMYVCLFHGGNAMTGETGLL